MSLTEAAATYKQQVMREPISGREASILALIAQRKLEHMTEKDKDRILAELTGTALEVAEAMVGRAKSPSKSARDAAAGIRDWAENL